MSQENVDLVRRLVDRLIGRDWDELSRLLTGDAEWWTPGGVLVFRGVDEWRRFWERDVADAWDLSRSTDEIEEVLDLGDQVVVVFRGIDYGRSSGIRVESVRGAVFRFRDRRICYMRVYPTPEAAMSAVGLGE